MTTPLETLDAQPEQQSPTIVRLPQQREAAEQELIALDFNPQRFSREVPTNRMNGVTVLVNVLEQKDEIPTQIEGNQFAFDIRIGILARVSNAHLFMRDHMLKPESTEIDETKERELETATQQFIADNDSFKVLTYLQDYFQGKQLESESVRRAQIIARLMALESAAKDQ